MDIKALLHELQNGDDAVQVASSAEAVLRKVRLAEEIEHAIRVDRAVVPEDALEALSEFGRESIVLIYVAHVHRLAVAAHRNLTAGTCVCIKLDR